MRHATIISKTAQYSGFHKYAVFISNEPNRLTVDAELLKKDQQLSLELLRVDLLAFAEQLLDELLRRAARITVAPVGVANGFCFQVSDN